MVDTLIAVFAFLLVLVGLVVIRNRSKSKVEFSLTDILIAVVPVVLWLLFSGKIQKFELGDLKFETALVEASRDKIAAVVTRVNTEAADRPSSDSGLPIDRVPTVTKGSGREPIDTGDFFDGQVEEGQVPMEFPETGPAQRTQQTQQTVGQVPTRTAQASRPPGAQGLILPVGSLRFAAGALRQYFPGPTSQGSLKYILLERQGRLVGMSEAGLLIDGLSALGGDPFRELARRLNEGDDRQWEVFPWFWKAEDAVTLDSSKLDALKKMEALGRDWLPAVDGQGTFQGIVDRSRLTTNLLLEVAKKLDQGGL